MAQTSGRSKARSRKSPQKKSAVLKRSQSKKAVRGGQKKASSKKGSPKKKSLRSLPLDQGLLTNIHRLMVKTRVLEERLIKIYKAGEAFFWIGGPGEEAFGVPLGLLAKKGQGPENDYFHLHYRCSPTLVALGMEMIDSIRLIMNRATDPSTGGRNFSNHYCFPKWNVTPVTSPIEVQYSFAIGTAKVQQRKKSRGITIVTGGDAGTAEGDFASSLIWASRPGQELPVLLTVQNNRWGISTDYASQHGEASIADRGKAFGIRTAQINGNDPIESYLELQSIMSEIRKTRKPALVEIMVSRLYGHSSADGANLRKELDPLKKFEEKLLKAGVLKSGDAKEVWKAYELEARSAQEQVRAESPPEPTSVWDHFYADNENGNWRHY